jgi:hypothetical protein
MERAVVVKGRMIGPTTVELSEPVRELSGDVEVILRDVRAAAEQPVQRLSEWLRSLPPTGRTKEDIDRQIQEERESWGDR